MKRIQLLVLSSALALTSGAFAADGSPYDTNPKCRERTTIADPDCVIQDDGDPRHTYPPATGIAPKRPILPPSLNPPTTNPPAVPPPVPPREGVRGGTRPGG
jgi:hypothetical protein